MITTLALAKSKNVMAMASAKMCSVRLVPLKLTAYPAIVWTVSAPIMIVESAKSAIVAVPVLMYRKAARAVIVPVTGRPVTVTEPVKKSMEFRAPKMVIA